MSDIANAFQIESLATGVPAHAVTQRALAASARARCARTEQHRQKIDRIFEHTTVRSRACVVATNGDTPTGQDQLAASYPAPVDAQDMGPSVGQRMRWYESQATPLAAAAARRAIQGASVEPADIGHLVTVSCTGFAAPGVDIQLIDMLGLPPAIGRTAVGFMGCHGALNGLRVAHAMALASPGRRVLTCCVELCSIHFQYGYDPQHIVANALFADGAAAVVGVAGSAGRATMRLLAQASTVLPDSSDAMGWNIRDHGFEMTLSPRVPGLVNEHLESWLGAWLSSQGLMIGTVAGWAIHPGGPKVIDAVESSLGLAAGAGDVSRAVLAEHGNMSSPTVLFILERLVERGVTGLCVVLAFGPGLVVEAALIELC